jgi:hypothetical protein
VTSLCLFRDNASFGASNGLWPIFLSTIANPHDPARIDLVLVPAGNDGYVHYRGSGRADQVSWGVFLKDLRPSEEVNGH